MEIREARSMVGCTVHLNWTDRKGDTHQGTSEIYKLEFVPMYGPCLITDFGELHLDKITGFDMVAAKAA